MTNNPIKFMNIGRHQSALKALFPLVKQSKTLFLDYRLLLIVYSFLTGCSTTQPPVPVVEHVRSDPSSVSTSKPAEVSNQFYTVQRGDTLYSIALSHGIDFKKLAEWNDITDPKTIRPGQKINLSAPARDSQPALFAVPQQPVSAVVEPTATPLAVTIPSEKSDVSKLKTSPKAIKLPFSEQNVARLQYPENSTSATQKPISVPPPSFPSPGIEKNTRIEAAPQPESQKSEKIANQSDAEWIWPTTGKLLSSFSKNSKGVKISGQTGQAILASAAGEVVYSGHGLRGYGNLIIIKHNSTFLSAYAHNSKILVKEGESVVRGQKIAEMGNTDTDTTQLHFEIRKHGKPVDPLEYLPNQS